MSNICKHTHYAEIPKIAQIELNPYEIALYNNIVQTCGWQPDGYCDKSNKTLADETSMSIRQVQRVRQSLSEKGFIFILSKGNESPPRVTLNHDVWARNAETYTKSSDETGMTHSHTPHDSQSYKEEPNNKNIKNTPSPQPKIEIKKPKKLTKHQRRTAVMAIHAFNVPVSEINNSKDWDKITGQNNVASRSAKIATHYQTAFSMYKIDNPNEPETMWDFAKWYKSINGQDCVIPHKLEKIKHWVERWAKILKNTQPGDLSAYRQVEEWETDYASLSPVAN